VAQVVAVCISENKGEPMHYLLFYEVADDYVERRAMYRDAHLDLAWKASERGGLVLAGALTNPVNDADAVAKALQDAGFDVTQTDADQAEMQGAIHALDGKLKAKGGADGSATHLSWQVGSSSYEGNGKLAGNLLTVDWGSSTTVVYALAAGGSLTGLWARARRL